MQKGIITIELDPCTFEETERLRAMMVELIRAGVFNIRNGSATLHFDSNGLLQMVSCDIITYRKSKGQSGVNQGTKESVAIQQSRDLTGNSVRK